MRFNDAFHFSRPTKREKTMRHRVVSKDNRTGSKVLLLLRETNEAMETSSSRKRFALLLLSPFFPRFPASPVPVSFPLRSNRYASFSTFFNHIELRIGAYQIFEKTIKNYFHFPRFQKSCRFEFRYVQTLATRYSPKVLRPSLLWFVFDSSLENALHILIVEGTFNFRISRYLSLVASLRYAAKVRCSFDNERVVNNTFDDQKKRSRGPRESVSSGFVTRCRAWWLFRSSHWP